MHRAALMADDDYTCNDPGRRPYGFWRYEMGLKPSPTGFRWPRGIKSEGHMIRKLVAEGVLEARGPVEQPSTPRRKARRG